MPSLMPGMPGTKEAYGISIIRKDGTVTIPPPAMSNYDLSGDSTVVLSTTHRGEGGFAVLNKERAEASVFGKIIATLIAAEKVYWQNQKAYAITTLKNGRLTLTDEMLEAFHLKPDAELMSVKSSTVALSFTPAEIWKLKFSKRGLNEAVENMSSLQVFQ